MARGDESGGRGTRGGDAPGPRLELVMPGTPGIVFATPRGVAPSRPTVEIIEIADEAEGAAWDEIVLARGGQAALDG